MPGTDNPSPSLLEYFRALRTEIVEAQKLRIQVGLAKTVFLGTLLGFFFKELNGDPAILICPFVALMFDCMVFGLSFNIRDVGTYIGEHIETEMALENTWQRHRVERRKDGFKDWGRIAFRVGSYGLTGAVTVVSFLKAMPPTGTRLLSGEWMWRIALMAILGVACGVLIYAEFPPKKLAFEGVWRRLTRRKSPNTQTKGLTGAADGTAKEA
jgi:hypothetical protein